MSSGKSSESSGQATLAILIGCLLLATFSVGVWLGAYVSIPDEGETYQAALVLNNWTNVTLNMTTFIFGNDWATIHTVLNHTENVTLIVTWQDVNETVAFIHSVGPGVYNTIMYPLEAGDWRTVLLI